MIVDSNIMKPLGIRSHINGMNENRVPRRLTPEFLVSCSVWLIAFVELRVPMMHQLQLLLLLGCVVYLVLGMPHFLRTDIIRVLPAAVCIAFFAYLLIKAGYINNPRTMGLSPGNASVEYVAKLIICILVLYLMGIKGKVDSFLDSALILQLCIIVANDLAAIFAPAAFGSFKNGLVVYLVGGKFSVAMQHMLLLSLIAGKRQKECGRMMSPLLSLGFAVSLLLCVRINCMTGAIGICLLYLTLTLLASGNVSLKKPLVILAILFISCSFFFAYDAILKSPQIQWLIQEVLHKSVDMTGRTLIYERLLDVLPGNLIWGFGLGTGGYYTSLIGGANTQNGLLEWVWAGGLPCATFLVLFIYFSMRPSRARIYSSKRTDALIGYLIAISFMCSVEVLIDMKYICIALIVGLYNNRAISSKRN